MIVQGHHHEGFQYEITKILHEKNLDITESDTRLDEKSNTERYEYIICSMNIGEFDEEELDELRDEIILTGGGARIKVIFEPVNKIKDGHLEIIVNGINVNDHRDNIINIVAEYNVKIVAIDTERDDDGNGTLVIRTERNVTEVIKEKLEDDIMKYEEDDDDVQIIVELLNDANHQFEGKTTEVTLPDDTNADITTVTVHEHIV